MTTASSPRDRAPMRFDDPRMAAAVAVVFAVVAALAMAHHEMWRDELQIWLIARDSGSLAELFTNLRAEPHPAFWHLLVYGAASLWPDPIAMQGLHLAIGVGLAYVFARYAPFPRLQRVLFCFGYLALYEYTVISRSYGLQFLCAFVSCALYGRRKTHPGSLGVALFLLASTQLHGVLFAAGLLVPLAWEVASDRSLARRYAPIAAGAALGIALSLGQMAVQIPNIGSDAYAGLRVELDAQRGARALGTVHHGFLPVPQLGDANFWNSYWADALPRAARNAVDALLGAALLIGSALLVARRPGPALAYVAGACAMLAITYLAWYGQLRNHAQIFMWFLVCDWLALTVEPSPSRGVVRRLADASGRWRAAGTRALTAMLLVGLGASVHAVRADWTRPFSNAQELARLLASREALREALVMGTRDFAVSPLAAYLDRPIYYPESQRFGTFIDWSERRGDVDVAETFAQAWRLLDRADEPIVLVLSYAPQSLLASDAVHLDGRVSVTQIALLEGAIVPDENYYVLLLEKLGRPEPPRARP